MTVQIICLIATMLVCLVLCRNLNRLDNIHMFRRALIDLAVRQVHKLNVQNFKDFLAKKDQIWSLVDKFTTNELLWSFKPLKPEKWFTEEELKLLGYENE